MTGFSNPTFGRQATNPQFQNPTTFNPKLNYSFVRGRHSIKVGYEFIAIRTEVLDINPLYGADTYNNQYSKPTCAQLSLGAGCAIPADPTSYDLADFYFGLPSTIQQGSNLVTNLRQYVHSLYVQDDWRVTPKLTLNVGLRWEFATPVYERDNLWSNFDPATNTLVRATNGSLFNRALVHPDYKDFGPRLGLAYSVDNKTSIRAGYRNQLLVLQPSRKRDRRNQRSAGSLRNVDSNSAAGSARFPHDAERLQCRYRLYIQPDQQQ